MLLNNETETDALATLSDDSRPLGFYGVRDWQVLRVSRYQHSDNTCADHIQVIDTDPSVSFTGQLTDTSQVEKFELTQEAYEQRHGLHLSLLFSLRARDDGL